MNLPIDQLMKQKLEQLRTRLLDLSLANRLLNFKHSPHGRSYLRIIDESPALLWARLQSGSLAFRPLPPIEEEPEDESEPAFIQAWQAARLSDKIYQSEIQALEYQEESLQREEKINATERSLKDRLRQALGLPPRLSLTMSLVEHAKRHGIDPSFDLPPTRDAKKNLPHDGIQLLLLPRIAEQQLSYVRDAAHQRLEETGINMLFCAFGFLQWVETSDSPIPLHAPLVLLPVEIKRELIQHQFVYTLRAADEEPILNLTLKEKLKQFGFILPDWEEKDSPETYWQRVEEALQSQKRWRIRRWITIGIFPFSRMAMYEDLDPNQPQLLHHPQTRDLLLGRESAPSQEKALHLKEECEAPQPAPLLVSKVDSSQYAAICKALQSPGMVIKGPPGTGKSQTITNLIAASLARGENVLFVADKQAALNVVFSRLKEAGLADFCLELHSHQATRTSVVQSLKKRLEMSIAERSENLKGKLKEIQEVHHALDQYNRFMKRSLGQSQQTVQEILWSARQASDKGNFPAALYRSYFESAEHLTPTHIQQAKKVLKGIEKAYDIAIEEGENLYEHPWRGIAKAALSPFQIEELQALFDKLLPELEKIESHCRAFAERYGANLHFLEETEQFGNQLAQILEWTDFPLTSLEQMEALWQSLPSPIASLARLEQEIDHAHRQIHSLEQLQQLCAAIGQAFNLEQPLPLKALKCLWSAVNELARTPLSLLKWRHAALYSPDSFHTLYQAQQQALALQQQAQILKKKFKLEQWNENIDLATYAQILEQGAWWSYLNPSFRHARRFYQAISLQPCNQTHTMAADLRELNHYFSNCKAFEYDSNLQNLCGPYFKGIETDFSSLAEAAQYGYDIHKRFPNHDSLHQAVRSTLLQGKEDNLQRLAAYIKHPMACALSHFLSVPHDNPDCTLSTLIEHWKIYQEKLMNLKGLARNSHLPSSFQFEDLPKWIAKGRSLRQVWKKWEEMRPIALACNQEELRSFVQALRKQIETIKTLWETSQCLGGIEEEVFFDNSQPFAHQSWDSLCLRIKFCLQHSEKLNSWSILGEALASAKQEGLDLIIRPFLEEKRPLKHLSEAYQMVLSRSLARHAYTLDDGLLSRFNGIDQEQLLARLSTLEKEMIQVSKEHLRTLLCERHPPSGVGHGKKSDYTELALIKHEISKQKRHIPIRQLMQRAKEAMRMLKPCFLMSPLSLAQYLPRDSLHFDLLVIDEASQMRPEEAIGAISRAKRVVIVGDPLQLPPTDFFVKTDDFATDEEEEAMNHESILDLALAIFPHVSELRWHYRSQHESLIAFSNHHFYDRRLIVLPTAHQRSSHLGVNWVAVPGIYHNGLNPIESQTVIRAAIEYMERYPDRSLGIVTLNRAQRDLLLEEFEYAIRHSPQAAAYMARWESTLQAPFIKNLENVQGDERDAIFISMVYGPNDQGTVAQHFGPINKAYGHRRLNVLFTRARLHLIVFSSLLPDQIKAEGKNPGVGILKSYLEYASTGRLEIGRDHGHEPESDFEKWVAEKIRAMGCQAIPQLGVAGYRIDIGIIHPSYPYGYLLGIECDGAAYHSSKEARERDRLRQDILEQLGWTIYRIWSTDWFRDPLTQTRRLQNFIENLILKKTQGLR